MAILGVSFACCALLLAGLPPLVGLHRQILCCCRRCSSRPRSAHRRGCGRATAWTLMALLMLSGLAVVIAMMRAGIRAFWVPTESTVPSVRVIEMAPIAALLLLCLALTVQAGPVMRFMQATAQSPARAADLCSGRSCRATRAAPPRRKAAHDALAALSAPVGSACWSCGCCSIRRSRLATSSSGASSASPAPADTGGTAASQRATATSRVPSLRLAVLVLTDIIRSNIVVARIILTPGRATREHRAS